MIKVEIMTNHIIVTNKCNTTMQEIDKFPNFFGR